jgi:hypothetical protein
MGKNWDPVSGINIPDDISEILGNINASDKNTYFGVTVNM